MPDVNISLNGEIDVVKNSGLEGTLSLTQYTLSGNISAEEQLAGDLSLNVTEIKYGTDLPDVTEEDNNKVLAVVDGEWTASELTSVIFATDDTLFVNNDGALSVNTTNNAEKDNTLPITSAGVYEQIGNIEVLLNAI